MRSFFSKIRAGFTAFLAWIVSPIAAILHSRRDSDKQPVSPNGYWLCSAEKLFPAVFGGRLELIFTHPTPLDDHHFRDLKITIFHPSERMGVTYEIDLDSSVRVYLGKTYRIPLKPADDQHAATAGLRAARTTEPSMLWTTNLERVLLRLGNESLVLVRQPSGFFAPTTERAA